jgi:hypothetical protein
MFDNSTSNVMLYVCCCFAYMPDHLAAYSMSLEQLCPGRSQTSVQAVVLRLWQLCD